MSAAADDFSQREARAKRAAASGTSAQISSFFKHAPKPAPLGSLELPPGVTLPEPTGTAAQRARTEALNAAVAKAIVEKEWRKKKRAKKSTLPPELKLAGTTTRCHPNEAIVPQSWYVDHTENHWANGESTMRYVTNILTPYKKRQIEALGLPAGQKGILLFDNFGAHIRSDVLMHMDSEGWEIYTLPPNCTSELQPCDALLNSAFKQKIKTHFIEWYSKDMLRLLNKKRELEKADPEAAKKFKLNVDVSLTRIKEPHVTWMSKAFNEVREDQDLGRQCWQEAGLGQLRDRAVIFA